MKIGFIAPLGIAAVNGGIRTQALQTAKHLQQLGIEIEFINPWQDQLNVDLVHVFSAGPGTLGIISRVAELGIKMVLSPIFFSNRSADIISRSLTAEKLLSKVGSGIRSDFGIKAEACSLADKVLPNTKAESELIEHGFSISASKISIIPNGVEQRFTEAKRELFIERYGSKDFVLFVGQAGAKRKNVRSLLEAAPKLNQPLVIIGSFYDNEYGRQCNKLATEASNVTLIESVEHDSEILMSAYAACTTFVLPSAYETPGIAALEAALAGANIAITQKGGTKDYFGDFAEYLSPDSTDSIAKAVNDSLNKKKNNDLKEHILNHFTWQIVAEKTKAEYEQLA